MKDLDTIYESLKNNGSNVYDALLTGKKCINAYFPSGYVGDPKFLNKLADIVTDVKSASPSCRFCRLFFLVKLIF